MPIRAIIVDFYDVLYGERDSAHRRAFEQSHGLPERGLRQALSQSKYFHDARLGYVSGETLWRDVAEHIGASPAEWQRLVSVYEPAFGLNEELMAFLQELHLRYKIALLSNATSHVRHVVTHRFHLGSLFDVMRRVFFIEHLGFCQPTEAWSNGMVEGFINKVKWIKRSSYGQAGFPLLQRRVEARILLTGLRLA